MAVLNAERIKLSTTRSPAVVGGRGRGPEPRVRRDAGPPSIGRSRGRRTGVVVFGVPLLMILSALTVTNEYRSGLIRTTFMAVPNRTLVLAAKAIVAMVVFRHLRRGDGGRVGRGGGAHPLDWRLVNAVALYAALAAMLGVGVGALLRASAGAVALLLLWPLVAEPLLGNMPIPVRRSVRTCRSRMRSPSSTCSGSIPTTPCHGDPWDRSDISPAWLPPRSSRRWSPSTGATHDGGCG